MPEDNGDNSVEEHGSDLVTGILDLWVERI